MLLGGMSSLRENIILDGLGARFVGVFWRMRVICVIEKGVGRGGGRGGEGAFLCE